MTTCTRWCDQERRARTVSLLLAALVIVRSRREVLIVVALLALAFTALEIAEVAHQIDANKTGLVALALLAGVLHALTAGLAVGGLFAKQAPQLTPEVV